MLSCIKVNYKSILHRFSFKSTAYKKQLLIEMIQNKEKKPKLRTTLRNALINYTNKKSNSFDPEFTKIVKKNAPEWLFTKSQTKEENKKKLLKLKNKPYWRSSLGMALSDYTKKYSKTYDPVFAKKIKSSKPNWFVSKSQMVEIKKQKILKLKKKPSYKSYLGYTLSRYIKKSSNCYDPNFYRKVKKTHPDWF